MSVEDTPAPDEVQDTPTDSAPDDGTRADEPQDVDWATEGPRWQKRHQDLEPEFTRKSQRLAELEAALQGDPRHTHLLSEFGIELEEPNTDQEDDEFEDEPLSQLEQRVRDFEEWKRQQEVDQDLAAFSDHLDELAGDLKLTQFERNAILNQSVAYGFNEQATERAFKEFKEEREAHDKDVIKRYGESKKAPHVSKVGSSATDQPNWDEMTDAEADKYMAERWEQAQQ